VGSIPFLGKERSLIHMLRYVASKYGPVAGIYLGSKPAVVITDFDVLKGMNTFIPMKSYFIGFLKRLPGCVEFDP
jgi:hypothetical protein